VRWPTHQFEGGIANCQRELPNEIELSQLACLPSRIAARVWPPSDTPPDFTDNRASLTLELVQTLELVERVYELVEAREIDKAVMVCLRLARSVNDTVNVVMFLRELHPDVPQLKSALFAETQHLDQAAREQVWEVTLERWIQERTFSHVPGSDDNSKNVLGMGAGDLLREVDGMEKSIEDLRLPPGLGEYDTAAFTDQHVRLKGEMRLKIRACNEVIERIRARCLYYAMRLESQLKAEAHTSALLGSFQRDVHNFYAEKCEPVFQSLRKAASLLGSTNTEDHALLLTCVRRAVKGAADYHYPPRSEPVTCYDGKVRDLGDEQYLNRLHELCAQHFDANASTAMLRAEFEYLAVFLRRLNDVASKGVHAQVSPVEARQGLLGVYTFLSNVIAKLNAPAVSV